MHLKVNGTAREVEPAWREETLLDVLREHLGLTGTRFGCGLGLCGACTVLVDGEPVRSCLLPVSSASGKQVLTIEGLADGPRMHAVQRAWVALNVPQCGYCQSGQIMSAVALLRRISRPSRSDVDAAMAGNLCRCGTQARVRAAIELASRAP